MTIEELQKVWKKILIDEGISETEFYKQINVNQSSTNRKIRTGTIKFIEFSEFLDKLNYSIEIRKNNNK